MIELILGVDPKLLALMQFLSSTLMAFAGFMVAVVALKVGYRNNFGWKPLVLLVSYGQSSQGDATQAHTTYEVWNRRKYPIAVREMSVQFRGVEPMKRDPDDGFDPDDRRYDPDGQYRIWKDVLLEPNQHERFNVTAPIGRYQKGRFTDPKITVYLFDPRSPPLLWSFGRTIARLRQHRSHRARAHGDSG